MSEMQTFWDWVGAMLEAHADNLSAHSGYLEIVAHGITYRSTPEDHHGLIEWTSWEPYRTVAHFSALTDPGATIKWVKK